MSKYEATVVSIINALSSERELSVDEVMVLQIDLHSLGFSKNYSLYENDGHFGALSAEDIADFCVKNPQALLSMEAPVLLKMIEHGQADRLASVINNCPDLILKEHLIGHINQNIQEQLGHKSIDQMSKDEIKVLQFNLKALGLYAMSIDGIPGRGTNAAIDGFGVVAERAQDNNNCPDAICGPPSPSEISVSFNDCSYGQHAGDTPTHNINHNILKTAKYYEGAAYGWDKTSKNKIDCSGLVLKAIENLAAEKSCHIKPGIAERCRRLSYADGLIYALDNEGLSIDKTRKLQSLRGGMVIGMDTGPKGRDANYKRGIDHIAISFEDESGNIFVAESTKGKGCIITPADEWISRNNRITRNFYVADMNEAVQQEVPAYAATTQTNTFIASTLR